MSYKIKNSFKNVSGNAKASSEEGILHMNDWGRRRNFGARSIRKAIRASATISAAKLWLISLRAGIAVLMLAFLVSGCGGVSSQAKQLLGVAALGARERAVTFAAMGKVLGAKDSKDESSVQRAISAHAAGLAADAKALADFVEVVSQDGLSKAGKAALADIARVSKARSENWTALSPILVAKGVPPAEWEQFSQAHADSLAGLAATYASLADAVADRPNPE